MFSNVISKDDLRQLGKRALLVALLLLVLVAIGVALNAVSAQRMNKDFEQAADFPRGALVYAQFQDLPALLKQWNESQLKARYLDSVSFQQMQSRHLAIKLLSRWEEFNTAAGFQIDLGVFGSLADNRAAIAVYDVGKLDLMLVAPMSDARFEACRFFQGKANFQENQLPDGGTYYLHDVEADRGRQKQHIAFAHTEGRFVLATSEKLLLRALANIKGQAKKDRLTDEPEFQSLARAVKPHFVTVWVQQSKLNDDWYFKHYWLMSDPADLKNIRAGMFDLEMQAGKWVEHREFLLNGKMANVGPGLSKQALQKIERIIPADTPFVQFHSVDNRSNLITDLVREALFDGKIETAKRENRVRWDRYSSEDFAVSSSDDEYYGNSRYSYLSHKFNSEVDEEENESEVDDSGLRMAGERRFALSLQMALQTARPTAAAKVVKPRAVEGMLFAEFARATIVSLQNPASLDRSALENAIGQLAASRLTIANASGSFVWKNRNGAGANWREMELPMLGRSVGYGLRGSELIISNNAELLGTLMTTRQAEQSLSSSPLSELTIIRFSERKAAFDHIFESLEKPLITAYWQQRRGEDANGPSQEFFSGEIASLLDVASPVGEVRIQRSYTNGRLREEVAVILN